MSLDECLDLDLTAAAELVASRQVSSRELVTAALHRIEHRQPRLNCFIELDGDGALRHADACDRELARGALRGPFHGIPSAHKDIFWRAGRQPTCGSKVDTGSPPAVTATAINRLAAAGAVDLGALNMAEFAFGPTGHNIHFGNCLNPYDPARIPGGSSSGSAVAVAARLVYAALGSDTGGSVRIPASLCNVVGLKPSDGRISRFGMMPLAPSLDTVGVLARSVRDCARLLDVLQGPDPFDRSALDRAEPGFARHLGRSLAGIRIGIPQGWYDDELDSDCAIVFERAVETLRGMGVTVIQVDGGQISAILSAMRSMILAEAAAIHAPYFQTQSHLYCGLARGRIEEGFKVEAIDYERALTSRAAMTETFLASAFEKVDVLATPAMTRMAPLVDAGDIRVTASEPFSRSLSTVTRPINFLSLPAISVPAGFTPDGMPLGLQLVAKPFAEALLLNLAAAYESETQWARQGPRWMEAE